MASAVPVFVTRVHVLPLSTENSSTPPSFPVSRLYLCQNFNFSRDELAGMGMPSLTRLSVFLVAGPLANHEVDGVWLAVVTVAQLEMPVVGLAVHPARLHVVSR